MRNELNLLFRTVRQLLDGGEFDESVFYRAEHEVSQAAEHIDLAEYQRVVSVANAMGTFIVDVSSFPDDDLLNARLYDSGRIELKLNPIPIRIRTIYHELAHWRQSPRLLNNIDKAETHAEAVAFLASLATVKLNTAWYSVPYIVNYATQDPTILNDHDLRRTIVADFQHLRATYLQGDDLS